MVWTQIFKHTEASKEPPEAATRRCSYKKCVLKICRKFTGENPCRSVISIKLHHPEVFSGKGVLKICSKFTGEHPCRSVISIKLLQYFPVNLLHIFRTPFAKNTSRRQLLISYLLKMILLRRHRTLDLEKREIIFVSLSKCSSILVVKCRQL